MSPKTRLLTNLFKKCFSLYKVLTELLFSAIISFLHLINQRCYKGIVWIISYNLQIAEKSDL